jgi:hypothetical protein
MGCVLTAVSGVCAAACGCVQEEEEIEEETAADGVGKGRGRCRLKSCKLRPPLFTVGGGGGGGVHPCGPDNCYLDFDGTDETYRGKEFCDKACHYPYAPNSRRRVHVLPFHFFPFFFSFFYSSLQQQSICAFDNCTEHNADLSSTSYPCRSVCLFDTREGSKDNGRCISVCDNNDHFGKRAGLCTLKGKCVV